MTPADARAGRGQRWRIALRLATGLLLLPVTLTAVLLLAAHFGSSKPIAVLSRPAPTAHMGAIPNGYGVLSGRLGPGLPGKGAVPALALVFDQGSTRVPAEVIGGRYEVLLPVGSWDVRTTDGSVCARGITVGPGAQSDDLVWPISGCQELGAR